MNTTSKKFSNDSKFNKIGIKEERIDLSNKVSENNKADSEMMLPHERDETTGPTGTNDVENEQSREIIKKAHDDTKHGLKDTDRHGIPSDLESSDSPQQVISEDIRKKKNN